MITLLRRRLGAARSFLRTRRDFALEDLALRHLGEPTEAPPMAPARYPPCYKTRAVRRTLGELDQPPSEDRTQGELF